MRCGVLVIEQRQQDESQRDHHQQQERGQKRHQIVHLVHRIPPVKLQRMSDRRYHRSEEDASGE